MTQWIKFRDKVPPVGKRILVTRPSSHTLGIVTLLYSFIHEEDKERGFPMGSTEDMLKTAGGYWMEIPEPPKD